MSEPRITSSPHDPHDAAAVATAASPAPMPLAHLLNAACDQIEAVDLFALLRQVDATSGSTRLGSSQTPREDTVRLAQHPSTIFAPSAVHSVDHLGKTSLPRINILSFGLFGPNGALPIHLTEHMRERLHHHDDQAPVDFVNLFHHRLISLFYRAWADTQSVVHLDRPGVDKFSFYCGSLIGMGFDDSWERDTVEDSAKLHAAGHLVRPSRNPEGLERLISHYFGVPCRLVEFVRSRIPIKEADQTQLCASGMNNQLGISTLVGRYVDDIHTRFRLVLGEMPLGQFESFLPTSPNNRKLRDWVRNYIGIEMDWDVQLLLKADDAPSTRLSGTSQLGWTSWLGRRKDRRPASEVRLNPELDAQRLEPAPT